MASDFTAGEGFSVDENGTVSYAVSGSADETRTAAVTISSENYEDAECRITVTLTDKNIPTVTVGDITATYTGKPLDASAAKGTAVFDGKPVSGVWSSDQPFSGASSSCIFLAASGAQVPFSIRPIRRFWNPRAVRCRRKASMGGNTSPLYVVVASTSRSNRNASLTAWV